MTSFSQQSIDSCKLLVKYINSHNYCICSLVETSFCNNLHRNLKVYKHYIVDTYNHFPPTCNGKAWQIRVQHYFVYRDKLAVSCCVAYGHVQPVYLTVNTNKIIFAIC